jgi:hypothetical protein
VSCSDHLVYEEIETYPKSPRICVQYGCFHHQYICLCSIAVASIKSWSHTPANTRLISKTRTPASGSFFEFGDFVAVAKPRRKHRLAGLVRMGVALATKATLDNGRQCMTKREIHTPLLIRYSFPETLLNSNSSYFVDLNSALCSWRAPLLDR